MIGIVVVSHSRALADAAVALAREMVPDPSKQPTIAVAAGLDETTFGTDATAVSAAIEEVDSPDGVLVLMDLGSAVLSADMAKEFLDPDLAGRVRLSSAPFVEGLLAAVVTASTGASIDAVAREADAALTPKAQQVGGAAADAGPAEPTPLSCGWHRGRSGPGSRSRSRSPTSTDSMPVRVRAWCRWSATMTSKSRRRTSPRVAGRSTPTASSCSRRSAPRTATRCALRRPVPTPMLPCEAIADLASRNFDDG